MLTVIVKRKNSMVKQNNSVKVLLTLGRIQLPWVIWCFTTFLPIFDKTGYLKFVIIKVKVISRYIADSEASVNQIINLATVSKQMVQLYRLKK